MFRPEERRKKCYSLFSFSLLNWPVFYSLCLDVCVRVGVQIVEKRKRVFFSSKMRKINHKRKSEKKGEEERRRGEEGEGERRRERGEEKKGGIGLTKPSQS